MRPAWLVPLIAIAIDVDGCNPEQPCRSDGHCQQGEQCVALAPCGNSGSYATVVCGCLDGRVICDDMTLSCSPQMSVDAGSFDAVRPMLDVSISPSLDAETPD